MADFKMYGLMLMLVALCATAVEVKKPEIVGTQKLSYSIVTSQNIVPGNEFLVHLTLFDVVNTTLYKGPTHTKNDVKIDSSKFLPEDRSINLNITLEGLVTYYHNLKIQVGDKPKNFSEVLKFVVPETQEWIERPLRNNTHFNPLRNRSVIIQASNNFYFNHTVRLPVVERKVHPMIILNKMSYLKGDLIKMAFLCHYSDMKPFKGAMNMSLVNPQGVEEMKWRFDRSPNGIIVRDVLVQKHFPAGLYNISLTVKGETVNKTIVISEEVKKNYNVKVFAPSHIAVHVKDESKTSGIKCTVEAFYPSGFPVKGMVETKVLLRNTTQTPKWTYLKFCKLESGICNSQTTLKELREILSLPQSFLWSQAVLDVQMKVIEERDEWHLSGHHSESFSTQYSSSVSGSSTTNPSSSTGSSSTTNPSSTSGSSSTTNPSSSTTYRSSSSSNPSSTSQYTSPSSSPQTGSSSSHSSVTPSGTISKDSELVDSSRIVVVNTTIVFTDEPITLEFPDFTPSTFKREQKYIGYINLRPLDIVSQSYQLMSLTPEQLVKLQNGEELNHLSQILKMYPQCPLTIDYLSVREVEIKIRQFANMPKTLTEKTTEKPISEQTLKLSVIPSLVKQFEFIGKKEASKVEIEAIYKDKVTEKTVRIVKEDIVVFQTGAKEFKTLRLELNQEKPNITVGEELKTKVLCNFPFKNIFYEIYNDQELVMAGHKEWTKEEKVQELKVKINGSESLVLPPVSRLLVWTTIGNEIITDSLLFVAERNNTNKTRLEVPQELLTKNRTFTATLYGRPNSDVLLFSSYEPLMLTSQSNPMLETYLKNLISKKLNLLAKNMKYSLLHSDHSMHPLSNSLLMPSPYASNCSRLHPELPGSSCLYAALLKRFDLTLNNYTSLPSLTHDSCRVFNESRSMVFTDGQLFKSPLNPLTLKQRKELQFKKSLLTDKTPEQQLETYLRNMEKLPMHHLSTPELDYFRIVRIPESGKINFTMQLPAVKRLYSFQALIVHSEHGIETLENPVQITVKPPVLTSLRVPKNVVEGEEFALKVKLHNTEPKPIEVEVVIREQPDFKVFCKNEGQKPVAASPNRMNYNGEFKTHIVKLQPQETVEHKFYIQTIKNPKRFEPTGIIVPIAVVYEKTTHVSYCDFKIQPMGETRELLKGKLIDLTKERREFEIDMELSGWNVTKENSKKSVKVYRDVMAPVIDHMCSNLNNLTMNAEYESISVALRGVSHILNGLRNDTELIENKWERIFNKLNESIDIESSVEQQKINIKRMQCLKKIVERYQSYFTRKYTPHHEVPESIWTSLDFLEGMVEWWNVADVNMTHPIRTIDWLISKQKPSGHFEESPLTPVHFDELAPNTESQNVPLTARVLIVLTKCKEQLPFNRTMIEKINQCIDKCRKHIESKIALPALTKMPYTINIACHALILCNSPKVFIAIARRDSLQVQRGQEVFFPYEQRPVYELTHKKSLSIMATGWAALSHLRSGNLNASRPICNWLLSQMKSNGRFVSAQDTSVALEALTWYSKLINKKNRVGLSHVVVTVPQGNKNWTFTFNSTETIIDITKILEQQGVEGKNLKVVLDGRGLVVLHEIVKTKETKPQNIETSESVTLKVTPSKQSDLYDSVRICLKKNKPSPKEYVFISVPILSGHVFSWERNLETLRDLKIKMQSVVNGTIQFYTSEITHTREKCFELKMEISQRIGNIQPRMVKACTYSEIGYPSMVSYSESHSKHQVESICPQCECTTSLTPKCPYWGYYYPYC